MVFRPIIPIWLMAVICVGILLFKRRGAFAYVRQIVAVILLFAINLRPKLPGVGVQLEKKHTNTQVLFVIDDTISMLAEDYQGGGTRLNGVKADCAYIVQELAGARFSIITFHNFASLLSPFTDNAEHIVNTIASIYPIEDLYARGSSLNTPKELMLAALKQAQDKTNGDVVLFFISDGEITDGSRTDSYSDLASYVDRGAVLGYGTTTGGTMHVMSYYDDEIVEIQDTSVYPFTAAVSKIDEGNLRQIADEIGIAYVHMTSQNEIDSVLADIQSHQAEIVSETESSETEKVDGIKDIYYWFALVLLVMLAAEAVLMLKKK